MPDIRNTLTIEDNASATLTGVSTLSSALLAIWKKFDGLSAESKLEASLRKAEVQARKVELGLAPVPQTVQRAAQAAQELPPPIEEAEEQATKLNRTFESTLDALNSLPSGNNLFSDLGDKINKVSNGLLGFVSQTKAFATQLYAALGPIGIIIMALYVVYQIMKTIVTAAVDFAKALAESFTNLVQWLQQAISVAQRLYSEFSNIMDTVDFVIGQTARIGILAPGTDTTRAWNEVYKLANATYSTIEDTAQLVTRSLTTGVFSGANAFEQSLVFAGLLNKTMIATGANAQQASSAIEQMMQGLGAGQLYWQDLRIILQQAPGVALVLAEGLNKLSEGAEIGIGDLRNLASEGYLTAERITSAFAVMSDEIDRMFEEMPRQWSHLENVFSNIWTNIIGTLGRADGALHSLVIRMEEFQAWLLETQEGQQVLREITRIFEFLIVVIDFATQQVARLYTYLQENSDVVIGILTAIGVAGFIAGLMIAIGFIAANWQMLLMIAICIYIAEEWLRTSDTTREAIYGMLVAFLTFVFKAWNVFATFANAFLVIVEWLVNLWNEKMWRMKVAFARMAVFLASVKKTMADAWVLFLQVIGETGVGIASSVGEVAHSIFTSIIKFINDLIPHLNALLDVAAFFGNGPGGILSTIELPGAYVPITLEGAMDAANIANNQLARAQSELSTLLIEGPEKWEAPELPKIADPAGTAEDLVSTLFDIFDQIMASLPQDSPKNNSKGKDSWEQISQLLGGDPTGAGGTGGTGGSVNPTGGRLDSIGTIESDVSISDENLQLLRDIAARDFLLNLSQVTPQVQVTFGDVKETADVEELAEVIATMMEEELASSLVYG